MGGWETFNINTFRKIILLNAIMPQLLNRFYDSYVKTLNIVVVFTFDVILTSISPSQKFLLDFVHKHYAINVKESFCGWVGGGGGLL